MTQKKTPKKICRVCRKGCGKASLKTALAKLPKRLVAEKRDRLTRLAKKALAAPSSMGTRRFLARLKSAGAPSYLLTALKRCEPLVYTACCSRPHHIGCEPEGVGDCVSCGAWLCAPCALSGPGCSACGSGATPSGKPEMSPMSPREIALAHRRLHGTPLEIPVEPAPGWREAALEKLSRQIEAERQRKKAEKHG